MLQGTTVVKVEIKPETLPDLIKWECPECGFMNREYSHCAEERTELQCKFCGKTFTRE